MFEYNIDGVICKINEKNSNMLMDIKVEKLKKGEVKLYKEECSEMAILLMSGNWKISWENIDREAKRTSLFDEEPICLHVSKSIEVKVEALEDTEILLQCTNNERSFEATYYNEENCKSDIFGEGVAQGTCRRVVRTIFDYNNAPYSNMVMGEVITYPGRWSSYPPHHHPQPEVYYYKFDKPQGFGVSIIGDNSFVAKDNSVALIQGGLVHPQSTAPGYAMYYCWMIRHLDNNPWTARIDDEAHTWILDEDAKIWEGK